MIKVRSLILVMQTASPQNVFLLSLFEYEFRYIFSHHNQSQVNLIRPEFSFAFTFVNLKVIDLVKNIVSLRSSFCVNGETHHVHLLLVLGTHCGAGLKPFTLAFQYCGVYGQGGRRD